jgi:hypothetical protein
MGMDLIHFPVYHVVSKLKFQSIYSQLVAEREKDRETAPQQEMTSSFDCRHRFTVSSLSACLRILLLF